MLQLTYVFKDTVFMPVYLELVMSPVKYWYAYTIIAVLFIVSAAFENIEEELMLTSVKYFVKINWKCVYV